MADVHDLWDQLTVASLGLSPAWRPTPTASASACAKQMHQRGFHAAPVIDHTGTLHSVHLAALRSLPPRSTVGDAMRPVEAAQVVTPTTPLSEVISRLRTHDALFARDSLGGIGVITLADLARPPFAAAMFASITELEQRLNQLLQLFDDVTVLVERALSPKAVKRIRDLVKERQRRRMELSFVQSLALEDRFDVVMAYPELWAQLADSKHAMRQLRKRCQKTRNTLAHGGTVLDIDRDVRTTLRHFADLDALSRQVADRVGDAIWTQFAFAEVQLDSGACLAWPSALPELRWPSLWVITAHNPDGKHESPDVNDERQAVLLDTLRGMGLRFDTGRGGRGSYWEASAVVRGTNRETATRIGRQFGQLGVFELTPSSQAVVRCSDGATVRKIPRVRTRTP